MKNYIFHEDYKGDRYAYGLQYRPIGIACQPDDFIIGSQRLHPDYRHGLIEYPRLLNQQEMNSYELEFVGASLTREALDLLVYQCECIWKDATTLYIEEGCLWMVNLQPDAGLYSVAIAKEFNGMLPELPWL